MADNEQINAEALYDYLLTGRIFRNASVSPVLPDSMRGTYHFLITQDGEILPLQIPEERAELGRGQDVDELRIGMIVGEDADAAPAQISALKSLDDLLASFAQYGGEDSRLPFHISQDFGNQKTLFDAVHPDVDLDIPGLPNSIERSGVEMGASLVAGLLLVHQIGNSSAVNEAPDASRRELIEVIAHLHTHSQDTDVDQNDKSWLSHLGEWSTRVAPVFSAAISGAAAGGPLGSAAAAGLAEGAISLGEKFLRRLEDEGYDLTNADAIEHALRHDPYVSEMIQDAAQDTALNALGVAVAAGGASYAFQIARNALLGSAAVSGGSNVVALEIQSGGEASTAAVIAAGLAGAVPYVGASGGGAYVRTNTEGLGL